MPGTTRTAPIADALGRALRDMRLSTPNSPAIAAVAGVLEWNPSRLSRYELNQRQPTPDDVAKILDALQSLGLDITDKQREDIINLARGIENPAWLATTLPEQQIQLTTLLEYEDKASEIIVVQPHVVPGLLQTSAYASAIMVKSDVPPSEIRMRVAVRLGRKDVLTREDPVKLTAIIDEAVLHRRVGGPEVTVKQLRHLLELAKLRNVDLRVIPRDSDWHEGLDGMFVLVKFPEDLPIVHLETKNSGLFLHSENDVAPYVTASEKVLHAAMSAERSLELIAREAKAIEETISQ